MAVTNEGGEQARGARRARLKHHVPSSYRPQLHMLANSVVAALTVLLLTRVPSWDHTPWWAYSAVLVGVVLANVVEYVLHRFPMHRRYRGLKRLFTEHAVQHHRFYTSKQMEALERRDYFFVLFPIEFGLLCLVMISSLYGLSALLAGVAFASVLAITLLAYVLVLDLAHLMCHLPARYFERGPLSLAPFVYLMRLHRRHHDPKAMRHVNFNITFPLVDWVAGTLDDGRERSGSVIDRLRARVSSTLSA